MISDTSTRYGCRVRRHGKSRPCSAYHASRCLWKRRIVRRGGGRTARSLARGLPAGRSASPSGHGASCRMAAWRTGCRSTSVMTPRAMAQKTAEALDHYLFSEKVAIRDVSSETALFVLAGPKAPETSERLMGARPPESQWSQATGKLGDTPVRLVSGGRETGEAEVGIAGPASEAPRMWDALVGAGARPVGLAAFDALRIEAGTPRLCHDVDESVLLPEIPFANFVSETKGCYPGQEVVVRIRDRGHVNRMLRGLLLDGDEVPPHGAEVVADDTSVGRVTSAAWAFGLERPIALAFVRRQHAEPGTRVAVRLGGRAVAASVSALPFTR